MTMRYTLTWHPFIQSEDNDHKYWMFINALTWLHKLQFTASVMLVRHNLNVSETVFVNYCNSQITSVKLISEFIVLKSLNGCKVEDLEFGAGWHSGTSKLDH
jgi:Trk-type K+ transport system membrane component